MPPPQARCMLDGVLAPCSLVYGLLGNGAAAVCPNNDCFGLTLRDIGGGYASFYRPNPNLLLNCSNYNGNAHASCAWSTGSLVWVADADQPLGLDIFHCPGCQSIWTNASGGADTAFVATAAVLVVVAASGELAGAAAACQPTVNVTPTQAGVYCRAWIPGNLISIGYDPRNGLHIGLFADPRGHSLIHIPLWPGP